MSELEIYFAHTLNTYDTPLEEALRQLITHTFHGIREIKIEDPNQPHHQEGYEKFKRDQPADVSGKHGGMNYFFEVVLKQMLTEDTQSVCVCQTFLDGKWGLGVAGEAEKFIRAGKPVWKIKAWDAPLQILTTDSFIRDPANGFFFLKRISSMEEKLILEKSSLLVVPHVETRLRTWEVYNKRKRPFETAHLAPVEPYPGFYPDEDKN